MIFFLCIQIFKDTHTYIYIYIYKCTIYRHIPFSNTRAESVLEKKDQTKPEIANQTKPNQHLKRHAVFFTMDLAFGSFHLFLAVWILGSEPFLVFNQKPQKPYCSLRGFPGKNIRKCHFCVDNLIFLSVAVFFSVFALMHLQNLFFVSKPLQLRWLSLAIHLPCEQ